MIMMRAKSTIFKTFTGVFLISLLASGCVKKECYTCRKYAPVPGGNGTYFIGTQKVCPENGNIYLIDPVPGDSTDLWECGQ